MLQGAGHEAAKQDRADLEGLLDEGGQRTSADHDIAPQRLSLAFRERLTFKLPVHILLDQRDVVGRQLAVRKAAHTEIVAIAVEPPTCSHVNGRERPLRRFGICSTAY